MASNDVMIKVVGDRFCLPYTTELFVKEKIQSPYSSHYDVFDSTGNTLLRVDGGARNLKRRRVMSDPAGFPVITIREQNPISWKQEWRIHEGESSDSNHFLFRVKRSSGSHFRDLDVYLGSRDDRGAGDFHVTRGIGFASLSCKVRRGYSIIAEVKHSYTWKSFMGRESFKIKVNAEVDYAFIVAVVVIMQENKNI